MKRLGKIAVGLAGALAINAGLCAPNPAVSRVGPSPHPVAIHNPLPDNASSDNPYAAIAVRNVFGLVAPAPPPDPALDELKNLPKITPTGIMGVFGHWQVLYKVAPAKPGPGAKEEYYTLSEGQRQDGIEVVKIDDKNSLVTFDNNGTTQELPLADVSASGSSAPSSPGGMNPGMPAGARGGNNGPGGFTRFGAGAGGSNGGSENNAPSFNGQPGNAANGGLNFGNSSPSQIYQPPASTMSPEDAQILIAAQHLKAIQDNNPIAPLFPPTVIDRQAGITQGDDTGGAPQAP